MSQRMSVQSSPRGSKLSPAVVDEVGQRLRKHAQKRWPKCRGIEVRSRGGFVYVDAQSRQDPELLPLCRLRYTGDIESWEFAYFAWSREVYEPSVLADGSLLGSPENCFDAAAFSVLS